MDTFLAELRNAYFTELQHSSGAILNTEFAAVGSLRLGIVNQIVSNIIDVKLNFSDVLRLQRMSLAQLLNGVKSGVSMLAAGVGLEGVDVDFQLF